MHNTIPALSQLPSWEGVPRVGIDTETRDPHIRTLGPGVGRPDSYIVGVSLCLEGRPPIYLPIRHEGGGNLPIEAVTQYLRDQFKGFTGEIVGMNLSYDLSWLDHDLGVTWPSIKAFRDIAIADPLIYELHASYSMDAIAKRHGCRTKDEFVLTAKAEALGLHPKKDLWMLPAQDVALYAATDAEIPLEILRKQEKLIEAFNLTKIWELETQVLPVLLKMQKRGVLIDQDQLERVEQWSIEEETKALALVHRETGIQIGLGEVWKAAALSPVFTAIGITLPRTPTGKPSIKKGDVLNYNHPVATAINRAREVNKLRTTFVKSVRNHMVNGRIHCRYNQIAREDDYGDQAGARYGRLSCSNPNLQQQPSRGEFAKLWRAIYIPEPGAVWTCNDFCFSSDTEVLTERGFIPFPELQENDRVAQVQPDTGVLSYEIPIERQKKFYEGQIVSIKGKTSTDLLVTPNHRCLLYNRKGEPMFLPAGSVRATHGLYQRISSRKEGTNRVDLHELISSVACQADGSLRVSHYRLKLKKDKKKKRLRQFCLLNNTYTGPQGFEFFTIPRSACTLLMGDKEKTFDRQKILSLCLEDRVRFLTELLHWDGTGRLGCGASYSTTNKRNAETVQETAILSGIGASIATWWGRNSTKPVYTVGFKSKEKIEISKYHICTEGYRDFVYCVSMPLGTVVVRRNGHVSITGQSQQEPRWTTHFAAIMKLPKAEEAAHEYRTNPKVDNHDMMAQLTGLERKAAKAIFLGLCYGEGGAKLCHTMGLPTRWALSLGDYSDRETLYFKTEAAAREAARNQPKGRKKFLYEAAGEEGQRILNQFNEKAPYIKQLSKKAQARAEDVGFIRTVGGRRLNFEEKADMSGYTFTYRALNRLIQGSSADQMKRAMVEIDRSMPDTFLQLQVHDETDSSVADCREARMIAEIMRESTTASVPFRVDIEMGLNWGHLIEIPS